MYDIKHLSLESDSETVIIFLTKFEAIISKDVGGDRQAKTHVSRQILDPHFLSQVCAQRCCHPLNLKLKPLTSSTHALLINLQKIFPPRE